MKLVRMKNLLLGFGLCLIVLYSLAALLLSVRDVPSITLAEQPVRPMTLAIFGASGTAGDGILKAALASPDVNKIHVFTRRQTERIKGGVATGKVVMTKHMDYLDYGDIVGQISEVDTVFWAIGISSLGMDEETYGMIHVDFPMQFVRAWSTANNSARLTFHYISSSDISEESTAMWAREKIRAENSLFEFASGTDLRVIAYRPDYIGPTKREAHLGQTFIYWFFKPLNAAVRATQIGQAMLEVSARNSEFASGSKLSTRKILTYSNAYQARIAE